MAAAIGVRSDYTSTDLRRLARRSGDADQVRRLLAVALILDGGSRSEAAKVAGVTLQIVRDWVLRFNEGGPDALATRKAPGRTSILNDEQRARLAAVVEAGPIPAAHGVVRWRLCDLAQWIWDEFTLSVTRHTSGASFARWAIVSSRRGHAIVARRAMTLPILKNCPRPSPPVRGRNGSWYCGRRRVAADSLLVA